MSGKPKKKEVHIPLLYKDVVSPWEVGMASRTNGTRVRGFYRVILQLPFGGSPRRPLMYCIHEDKPVSAVLKKPPKISLAQTDVCFLLLLCVPRGLVGDSALCQLHSGVHVDGEAPVWTKAGYHGWLPWLGNMCHLECHKLLPLTFSWPNQTLCSCPSSTGCGSTVLPGGQKRTTRYW